MARLRSGTTPLLTVVLALTTGLSIGSNPSFQPLVWVRELLAGPGFESQKPNAPEAAAPAQLVLGNSGAETPELKLLRKAESLLFPSLFASDLNASRQVSGLLLGAGTLPPLDDFSDLKAPDISVPNEEEVGVCLRFFTETASGRALVERWLERRGRYQPFVDRALELARLPRALEAIVLAESGYHPRATSPAGAVGLWQLMPETAREYGLTIEKTHDERRDPRTASEAAVKHLAMLRQRLGTWELVLAAYNAGSKRIEDGLAHAGVKDYWALARKGTLPRETVLYVPKVLALSLLLENLDTFGFKRVDSLTKASLSPAQAIAGPPLLPGPGQLDPNRFGTRLLSNLDLDPAPGLLEPFLAKDTHAIVVAPSAGLGPSAAEATALDGELSDRGHDSELLTLVSDLGTGVLAKPATLSYERSYRVVAGDSLSKIAEVFGVEPSLVVRHNRLDNPSLVRVGQELRIPSPNADSMPRRQEPLVTMYFASPGDTISKIARSFGVSERELVLDNDLKNPGYVREGQILRIRLPRTQARSYLNQRSSDELERAGIFKSSERSYVK